MKYVPMSFVILSDFDRELILDLIEKAGRTCYKSESKFNAQSRIDFIKLIMKRGHLSVIEHASVSVRIICNRGVSHELVRHRLASYSQESTRYCDYGNDTKFSGGITTIQIPVENLNFEDSVINSEIEDEFCRAMRHAEQSYKKLRKLGVPPQLARNVLPLNLKTEVVITANLREWRHIFTMRCAKDAHPQIREIMLKILTTFKKELPEIYGDLFVGGL